MFERLRNREEFLWINQNVAPALTFTHEGCTISPEDLITAYDYIQDHFDFLKLLFPESFENREEFSSPLLGISEYQRAIITFVGGVIPGAWYLKGDHKLPISGSIKARGGFYTLLKLADKMLLDAGLPLTKYCKDLNTLKQIKQYLNQYTVVVGSTGNLGLSIGIIGKQLGFNVEIHMSRDAKPWKIDALRSKGAEVVLHQGSYELALKTARLESESKPNFIFIDDENSLELFLGYAAAGIELKKQFDEIDVTIDHEHPLFVYLPCGVGGAPSGIAYALKIIYGKNAHVFLAEPTSAPCMLLSLMTDKGREIGIEDIGLDGQTEADGLAVGRSSKLAFEVLRGLSSGAYTISDEKLLRMLYLMYASEGITLEPSACAGLIGPVKLFYETPGFEYLKNMNLLEYAGQAIHLSWATGGDMVPDAEMSAYIKTGQDSNVMTF